MEEQFYELKYSNYGLMKTFTRSLMLSTIIRQKYKKKKAN